jgi:dipeptide/tripeptide permease
MVTKLSPHRIVATMMGAFFLGMSASNFISGLIAQLTSVDRVEGELSDPVTQETDAPGQGYRTGALSRTR